MKKRVRIARHKRIRTAILSGSGIEVTLPLTPANRFMQQSTAAVWLAMHNLAYTREVAEEIAEKYTDLISREIMLRRKRVASGNFLEQTRAEVKASPLLRGKGMGWWTFNHRSGFQVDVLSTDYAEDIEKGLKPTDPKVTGMSMSTVVDWVKNKDSFLRKWGNTGIIIGKEKPEATAKRVFNAIKKSGVKSSKYVFDYVNPYTGIPVYQYKTDTLFEAVDKEIVKFIKEAVDRHTAKINRVITNLMKEDIDKEIEGIIPLYKNLMQRSEHIRRDLLGAIDLIRKEIEIDGEISLYKQDEEAKEHEALIRRKLDKSLPEKIIKYVHELNNVRARNEVELNQEVIEAMDEIATSFLHLGVRAAYHRKHHRRRDVLSPSDIRKAVKDRADIAYSRIKKIKITPRRPFYTED